MLAHADGRVASCELRAGMALIGGQMMEVKHRPVRLQRWVIVLGLASVLHPLVFGARAEAQTIDLYVDQASGQVYTQPGENRTKLGTFQRVDQPTAEAGEAKPAVPAQVEAAPPPAVPTPVVADAKTPAPEEGDASVVAAVGRVLKGKWYERISLRGYTQFRYNAVFDKDGNGEWFVPADRSVRNDPAFFIRRGRLILSGDVTDHLYVYVQPDLNAAPTDGDFSVQLRDLYADIAIDSDKEFRFRVGQSKVPFGWVNLQSSQNRLALERPDAINSAAEGERDVGVFFYWAPAAMRARLRDLVRNGLKGSGDYGILGLGVYSGQGLNRLDFNNNLHAIGRLTYPFQFANGQIFEPGLQAYWGKFVPRTAQLTVAGSAITPAVPSSGVNDRRAGISFALYPQPIGVEGEWNVGGGPQLADNYRSIDEEFLHGGYVQVSYRMEVYGTLFPFVRWQYYDGSRKFARNAPQVDVSEWDFGLEWSPLPELELATIYSYTPYRTDSNDPPYERFNHASRLGLQLQWNY